MPKKIANKKGNLITEITTIFSKKFWTVRRVLLGVFCLALVIDILTKQFVIYLGYGDFFKIAFEEGFKYTGIIFGRITKFFNLVLVYNKGISFSMLTSNVPVMRWVLSAIALIIVIFILQSIQEEKKLANKACLTLVIAGAIGNVIDRVRFGAVVDFLDFHVAGYHWPAFNFADMCISCGVGIFVVLKVVEYFKSK